jgi:hypothetical protein
MTARVGGIVKGPVQFPANATTSARVAVDEGMLARESAVAEFKQKIRSLEQAAIKGDLNVPGNRGGVWLNDLESARSSTTPSPVVNIVASAVKDAFANITPQNDSMSPVEMLRSHRGYRLKQLEIDEQFFDEKVL